jgi:hypothetical protein
VAAGATSAPAPSVDAAPGDVPSGDVRSGDAVSGEKLVEAAVEILGARITDIRPRQRPV